MSIMKSFKELLSNLLLRGLKEKIMKRKSKLSRGWIKVMINFEFWDECSQGTWTTNSLLFSFGRTLKTIKTTFLNEWETHLQQNTAIIFTNTSKFGKLLTERNIWRSLFNIRMRLFIKMQNLKTKFRFLSKVSKLLSSIIKKEKSKRLNDVWIFF